MEEKIRPGAWLYWFAGFILVAGIAAFVILLVTTLSGIGTSYQQVVVPGKGDITIESKGRYTIFHEYRSIVGDKVYNTERDISGLKCTLVNKSTNQKIPVSISWVSSNYQVGNRAGYSVFEFKIDQPGTYELSAQYEGNQNGPETVLAVGQGFFGSLLLSIFGGIGALFVSIIACIIIVFVTYRKRSGYKRQFEDRFY